jgi:hypothetical protein
LSHAAARDKRLDKASPDESVWLPDKGWIACCLAFYNISATTPTIISIEGLLLVSI